MKKIHISLLLSAAVMAGMAPAAAESLSPSQAVARLQGSTSARKIAGSTGNLRLVHTSLLGEDTTPAYYVFNKASGGYVILSADDRLAPLLADVDNGSFVLEELPESVRWWLGEYEREISWYLNSANQTDNGEGNAASRQVRQKDTRKDVTPLIKTHWSQSYPYNLKCPKIGGQSCQTGCVATATAQIVNYYRWPETHGFGSYSYTSVSGYSYSYDFGSTTFQWDEMLDNYSQTVGTSAQNDAVATLMVACGMAVGMDYGVRESGALSHFIPNGLIEYFGFASSTSYVLRNTYSTWEWEELIYGEIAAGRPVNYGGVGSAGGHQFVADGYRTDGMFHINWGWSGTSDGYYRLTALDPPTLGVGGGNGGFNSDQRAVVYCCPPSQADGLAPILPIYIRGQMSIMSEENTSSGVIIRIGFNDGGIFSNSGKDISGRFGLIITDENDTRLRVDGYSDINFPKSDLDGANGFRSLYAIVPKLPEGIYHLYPSFRPKGGEWTVVPITNGASRYITATVDKGGKVTFSEGALKELPELEVEEFITPEEIQRNEPTEVKVSFVNGDAQYDGKVYLCLSAPEDEADATLGSIDVRMAANKSATYDMEVTIDLKQGDHEVYLADCLRRRISSNFNIKIYDKDSAVSGIEDNTGVETRVFDLQGRELPSIPTKAGIYIVKRGTTTHKIVISR